MSARNGSSTVDAGDSIRTASARNGAGTVSRRNGGGTFSDRTRRVRERNDHDAATVLAVVLAVSGAAGSEEASADTRPQSVWSDPVFRLEGARHPSPVAWWASAMPR